MTAHHTGLCSYVLRTATGEYVYDSRFPIWGADRDAAQMWLWQPELLDVELVALRDRVRWIGGVTAVRARP